MFKRAIYKELMKRMQEPRRFIQVLAGSRQTGKTTLVRQVLEGTNILQHYATADEPALKDRSWIEQQWEIGRRRAVGKEGIQTAVLALDEIQKIPGWSETVKRLWDEDTANSIPLHVIVLGSAPLLVQKGLSESLAGRFETIPVTHWSYQEMRDAFGWDLDQYVYYGGYPGAAPLISEPDRWRRYILDALVETSLSRDILLMQRVDKPALLRRLFEVGCLYSGQILSYTKVLGQLQDAGNTTTLAHYLELLKGAGLLEGLRKYAGQKVRQRAGSPKFQVYNNALITSQGHLTFEEAKDQSDYWGRLVESMVGAMLVNESKRASTSVFYWSSRNREVDFVLAKGDRIVAIEVKSGRKITSLPGITAFSKDFDVHKKLLVGKGGIPLEEFLLTDVAAWF
ncbi:MAG: AAA family ATPase [Actinobacteria bacterium]|nr:AAA family ATPase [Actinomycetota bacterium]